MEFQTPNFGMSNPWFLWVLEETEYRVSLFLSAFQINKSK